MLNHHVLFWLKEDNTQDQKAAFRKGLESLKDIETIRHFHVGTPVPTDRDVVDSSYTFSLNVVFDDIDGLDSYQIHPLHLAFLDQFRILFDEVVIYDSI
ncbi:Dabb family protein [Chryseobacterium sp. Mn2064]|uniref:Dabb family protein n=1 Tax=Chryseobacterium sp. Mn2064 TaxID=3395263 RepID=UPI003BE0AC6F